MLMSLGFPKSIIFVLLNKKMALSMDRMKNKIYLEKLRVLGSLMFLLLGSYNLNVAGKVCFKTLHLGK